MQKKLTKPSNDSSIIGVLSNFWMTAPVVHFFSPLSTDQLQRTKDEDDENARRTQELLKERELIQKEAEDARKEMLDLSKRFT